MSAKTQYAPPVKYTREQLDAYRLEDLKTDLRCALRDWPEPSDEEAGYIAKLREAIGALEGRPHCGACDCEECNAYDQA